MRLRGTKVRVCLILSIVCIVGLAFSPSSAEIVSFGEGCNFQAEAVVGPDGLTPLPVPVPPVNTPVGDPVFLLNNLSAGCFHSFSCTSLCTALVDFGFAGLGLVSGRVEIVDREFRLVAFGRCGIAVNVCSGSTIAELTTGSYFLTCRMDGVAAVLVSGSCGLREV